MHDIDGTMLVIGTIPQYFFDNVVIDQVQDLTRTFHAPEKVPGPLIRKDRPWENVPYLTHGNWTVLRHPDTDAFLCWYEDWRFDPEADARCERTFGSPVHSRVCFARSDDGLRFEKPALDYLVEDGVKTNVILGDDASRKSEVSIVFLDPLEADPARRFKMLFERQTPEGHRFAIGASADGIRWTTIASDPRFGTFGGRLGDGFIPFVDMNARVYRMTCRHSANQKIHHDARRPQTTGVFFPPTYPQDPVRTNQRRIFQAVSRDLVHWSVPQCILAPDEEENLDETFYGMVSMRLGGIDLGFLNTIHEVANTMNIRLAYSRDGWRWHHLDQRRPWLPTSPGSWDCSMVNMSCPPIRVGDELYVYHGGASNHHDWWINGRRDDLPVPEAHDLDQVRYGIGLAKLRLDGFVSLDAGIREGILVTQLLHTDARRLELNAACGDRGFVEVEATDGDEGPFEGFARGDCVRFTGDGVRTAITWKGGAEIPHAGSVRLRFFLRDASLYSFRFHA